METSRLPRKLFTASILPVLLAGCIGGYHGQQQSHPNTTSAKYRHVAFMSPAPMAMSATEQRYSTQVADKSVNSHNAGVGEHYARVNENPFQAVLDYPQSTFSIDVDTAAYSNIRRYLNDGSLPGRDMVRIEELINYFPYEYEQPEDARPFAVAGEVAASPWQPAHRLVRIGIKGKEMSLDKLPAGNLVFLVDVSGSMHDELPLVKAGLRMLVEQLRDNDSVAIVAYAGEARLALPATRGNDEGKRQMLASIEALEAGGSTAGGAAIELAYETAKDNFIAHGNNRVILATDGDFNVGVSSVSQLHTLIEAERDGGVFLSVLGFGTGNLNDAGMETLADKGNGNYSYIDGFSEARRVLQEQLSGTLLTIASDVKIQVEFNPAKVDSYRLIGYENRLLRNEEFNDDTRDAGELGAGHTVTALYEVIPAKAVDGESAERTLRYVERRVKSEALEQTEIATVKLRYKLPGEAESELMQFIVSDQERSIEEASENLRFASAVAEFGLLLLDSEYKGTASYDSLIARASGARGDDTNGYRSEFINLARDARTISQQSPADG